MLELKLKPETEEALRKKGKLDIATSSPSHYDQNRRTSGELAREDDMMMLMHRHIDVTGPDIETLIIREVAIGKGLSGALDFIRARGALKQSNSTIEWAGRSAEKKRSKLDIINNIDDEKVGGGGNGYGNNRFNFEDICIERLDEFGRTMTAKEAFRQLSYRFHGKWPGRKKQEKRMRQYQQEVEMKQMENSDTSSRTAARMREVLAHLKTPYFVLSVLRKTGSSDHHPSKDKYNNIPGNLTPMLGDRKFVGIKRKAADPPHSSTPKKPTASTTAGPKL